MCALLLKRGFNGPLPVNNGHVELGVCKHDTPTESDPGEGIKAALIRAGSKRRRRVFVCTCQGRREQSVCLTRTNTLF